MAQHHGEVQVATSLVTRSLERPDPADRAHLHLLLTWTLMMDGHLDRATAAQSEAQALLDPDDHRDQYWNAALTVALARRREDPRQLAAAWHAAREWVLRQPVDLYLLLPLGEFLLAGVRMRDRAHVEGSVTAAWRLLSALGDPIGWSASLHWASIQAAILANRPPDIQQHASALVRSASRLPLAAALAGAGRAWAHVLTGRVDAEQVLRAAQELRRVGQALDARRLLGHAAPHAGSSRETGLLLDAARVLSSESEAPREEAADDGSSLSAREREVATLVLRGHTYREIGETLDLSARTVEHHVARIKRRVGVFSRSELLERLRALEL